MRSVLLVGLFVSGLFVLANSQVDTMRLLEVGSVTAPGAITNWYFEDLNGDSIKEIILTTANSVNIYSGQSFTPIWSQSGFTNPKDLNFADINNDGLVDFSVKDTSHIYLIDPHHSATLWTSPVLDSTYRCYTIGDRTGDGWIDVVTLRQESFQRYNQSGNRDTIWLNTAEGPNYTAGQNSIGGAQMEDYWNANHDFHIVINERPVRLEILNLTSSRQRRPIILALSAWNRTSDGVTIHTRISSGRIFVLDAATLDTLNSTSDEYANNINFKVETINDSSFLYLLGRDEHVSSSGAMMDIYYKSSDISFTTINQREIFYCNRFNGNPFGDCFGNVLLDDFISSNTGDEICYFYLPHLYMRASGNLGALWTTSNPADSFAVEFKYNRSSNSNDTAYVVCRVASNWTMLYLYKFIYARNGTIRYILPTTNVVLSGAIELQNTIHDYLYAVNSNTIHLYYLGPRVGIDEGGNIPSTFFLSSNYPNPFNASTVIEYGLPESGPVKVGIFDILGRKVQTLIDETQLAGYHQVIWNGEDAPSGTYFYRIQTGEKSQTRKCLLLK